MATRTAGLPVHDVHLRILDYIVADRTSWEDSRTYLQLRLLSKPLRSHFEKALFRDTRLKIAGSLLSSFSALRHLHHILTTNIKLAGRIKYLTIDCVRLARFPAQRRERALPTQSAIDRQARKGIDTGIDKDLASVIALCTAVEVLDLQATDIQQSAVPIFTYQSAQNHVDLRHVKLHDNAMFRHIVDYRSANLCNISSTILPNRRCFNTPVQELNYALEAYKQRFPMQISHPSGWMLFICRKPRQLFIGSWQAHMPIRDLAASSFM